MAVVEQPIEHHRGDHLITKHLTPSLATTSLVFCDRCGKVMTILARMVEPSHHRLC